MTIFRDVTIILPAMNETFSLKKTVEIILETCDLKDINELLIVLSRNSTDECKKTADEIFAIYNKIIKITIYYQQKNYVGAAFKEAFDLSNGSHTIMMSTDLETPPKLVSVFIEKSKEFPNDIITASRWIKGGGFRQYYFVKKILNYSFQKIISLIFFSMNTDLTYAYRIFPTILLKRINWEEVKHPFFLETALKPLRLGMKIREIPAVWEARTEGVSQNTFFENFRYFKTALRIRCMDSTDIYKVVK